MYPLGSLEKLSMKSRCIFNWFMDSIVSWIWQKNQSRCYSIPPTLQWLWGQRHQHLCNPCNTQRWQLYTADTCRSSWLFPFKEGVNPNPALTFRFHLYSYSASTYRILLHLRHWTAAWCAIYNTEVMSLHNVVTSCVESVFLPGLGFFRKGAI